MRTCCARRCGCYHNLTQILRLALSGPFDPKAAGAGLLELLSKANGLPNFPTLDAHLAETQQKVRASFNRILGATLTWRDVIWRGVTASCNQAGTAVRFFTLSISEALRA